MMKFEKLKVDELKSFCKKNGIEVKSKNKKDLIESAYKHERTLIDEAIQPGNCLELLKAKIALLADKYADTLKSKILNRKIEMETDDNSHYLIYRVLGISYDEGQLIDQYQNTGRFLYKYAGSFLE